VVPKVLYVYPIGANAFDEYFKRILESAASSNTERECSCPLKIHRVKSIIIQHNNPKTKKIKTYNNVLKSKIWDYAEIRRK
jgi:hypothetical protein